MTKPVTLIAESRVLWHQYHENKYQRTRLKHRMRKLDPAVKKLG